MPRVEVNGMKGVLLLSTFLSAGGAACGSTAPEFSFSMRVNHDVLNVDLLVNDEAAIDLGAEFVYERTFPSYADARLVDLVVVSTVGSVSHAITTGPSACDALCTKALLDEVDPNDPCSGLELETASLFLRVQLDATLSESHLSCSGSGRTLSRAP